jgi:hypothetical protein
MPSAQRPSSPKKATKKTDSTLAGMSSASIEADVAAFLAKGEHIEEVPQGVSGMPDRPSKHIVISRK